MRGFRTLITIGFLTIFLTASALAEEGPGLSPDQALQKLMDGNKRYVTNKVLHPDATPERRAELAKGQHPYAVVLGCADSRVPPEIIFDEGLGDIFVVRVAGNIADDAVLGSIEYAVEHLGAPLVLVLGHESCGAVKATVEGGEAPGHIGSLIEEIKPAVEMAKKEKGDLLNNAIKDNVRLVVAELKESKPILSELVEKRKIKIVGGRYDLDTGVVEMVN